MSAFLLSLVDALLDVIRPLELSLRRPDTFGILLLLHGWLPPREMEYLETVRGILRLPDDVARLTDAIHALRTTSAHEAEALAELVVSAVELVQRVQRLSDMPVPQGMPPPLDQELFWRAFPEDLVSGLLADFLQRAHPVLFAPLHLLGIIEDRLVRSDGSPGRVDYTRWSVHWDRLVEVLRSPERLLRDVYGWGSDGATFDHATLLRRLERIALVMGLPAGRRSLAAGHLTEYYGKDGELRGVVSELVAPLAIRRSAGGAYFETGFSCVPIPPSGMKDAAPVGLLIGPYFCGAASAVVSVGRRHFLRLRGGLTAATPVGIEIRPGRVTLRGSTEAQLDLGATYSFEPVRPHIIVGDKEGHRLQLRDASFGLAVSGEATAPDLSIRLAATELTLVLDFSREDGFLSRLFGKAPIQASADVALEWSTKRGFSVDGRLGLTLERPLDVSLAFLRLERFYLELVAGDDGVAATAMVAASAKLGPLSLSVDRMGLALAARPVPAGQPPGTFGDLDLSLGFQPPRGIGLALDAGPVKGAGAISYDADRGLYLGALHLEVAGKFGLNVAGLLQTKRPDGTEGLSLVVVGNFTFPKPIPLAFGFTLIGVGALVGVNRTAAIDVLGGQLKSGGLEKALFPGDPIESIGQLGEALQRLFPAKDGGFVIGIFAQLGWLAFNKDTLALDLGLIYDTSNPLRLTALARVAVHAKVVTLNILAFGVLDLGDGSLSLRATIYDSKVGGMDLSGDAALLVRWGHDPTLLLSIGGFHPRFPQPQGIPHLERVTLKTPSMGGLDLSLRGYLALAGGTLQFGARLDLKVDVFDVIKFRGAAWFDVLVNLSLDDFYFEADLGAEVAAELLGFELFSIHLDARIKGPRTWHIEGHVTVSILWWDVEVAFEAGTTPDRALPGEETVDATLVAALNDARNWGAIGARAPLVAMRKGIAATPDVARIHPSDSLVVSQKMVPLDTKTRPITRFGDKRAKAPAASYCITEYKVGGSKVVVQERMTDLFAPGLFFDLATDEEKLAGSGFQRMGSGLRIDLVKDVQTDAPQAFKVLEAEEKIYTETLLEADKVPVIAPKASSLPVDLVVAPSASARAPLRRTGAARYRGASGRPSKFIDEGELP